jgi:hypothetical protein
MASTTNVVQIDADYLKGIQSRIEAVLTEVNEQLQGVGQFSGMWLNPVNSSFSVEAGGSGFDVATALNSALKTMGGTVNERLTWLQKVLQDMDAEITTTINSFSKNESLNKEDISTLMNDFQNTIKDMSNPSGTTTPTPSGSS